MIQSEKRRERLLLVGVRQQDGDDTEDSLSELKELVETAGGEPVGTVIQNREKMHPGTYVGKGKAEEIRTMLSELSATTSCLRRSFGICRIFWIRR